MSANKTKMSEYMNYSVANFGISLLTLTASSYILYFYTDVLLLPLKLVSVLLFVCRAVDGAIDPAIGFWMDRRHGRFGKYRGYIVFWALPACVFHAAMFAPPRLTGTALVIYCFVIYLCWAFANSVIECAHRPMLITINGSPERRRALNTARIAMGIMAALAASYLPLILAEKTGGGSERRGFAVTMAIFAVFALAAMLIGSLKIRENNITRDSTLSVKEAVRELMHDKRITLLVVMYLCSQIGNSVKSQTTIYYMKYNLNRADLTATLMMTGVLSSFLTQPFIVMASKRVKTMTLMLAGYVFSCLGMVVIAISGQSVALLFAGNILFGIVSAFPGNLIHAYAADLAENISGQNSFGGFMTSLLGLSVRIGQSLSGAVISVILHITGYVPNTGQSPSALIGIWGCLSGLTFITYLTAAITAAASRRITRDAP